MWGGWKFLVPKNTAQGTRLHVNLGERNQVEYV